MIKNESILKLLDYYKSHIEEKDILKDIYDGSMWKKVMNEQDMKEADLKIGISFCYDGLDTFNSGNGTGKF